MSSLKERRVLPQLFGALWWPHLSRGSTVYSGPGLLVVPPSPASTPFNIPLTGMDFNESHLQVPPDVFTAYSLTSGTSIGKLYRVRYILVSHLYRRSWTIGNECDKHTNV